MVIKTLRMVVKNEKRDEVVQTVRGILEPTRWMHSGCVSYRFYQDIEDENAFILVGEWKTQEDLEEHLRTSIFKKLLMVMDLSKESPEIKFNTILYTAGIEIVKRALGMNNESTFKP